MKKKLSILIVIITATAASVGIVRAAGFATDWLKVGSQGVGGVMYFNGTVINETTDDDGNGIPVTFGDDVRIDGRIWRGETSGAGDDKPLIINDDVIVEGNLTAATLQEMITGQVGTGALASSTSTEELMPSTWTAVIHGIWQDAAVANCQYRTSQEFTVTFTPTTETTGQYTASTYYPFKPFHDLNAGCVPLSWYEQDSEIQGAYTIVENTIFAVAEGLTTGRPVAESITDQSSASAIFVTGSVVRSTSVVSINGETMVLTSSDTSPSPVIVLTRQ